MTDPFQAPQAQDPATQLWKKSRTGAYVRYFGKHRTVQNYIRFQLSCCLILAAFTILYPLGGTFITEESHPIIQRLHKSLQWVPYITACGIIGEIIETLIILRYRRYDMTDDDKTAPDG